MGSERQGSLEPEYTCRLDRQTQTRYHGNQGVFWNMDQRCSHHAAEHATDHALPKALVRNATSGSNVVVIDASTSTRVPPVPTWATDLTCVKMVSKVVAFPFVDGIENSEAACQLVIRTGPDAALVSVVLENVNDWSVPSLDAAVFEMISRALRTLGETGFAKPVRSWNFLPGIGASIGNGLDRYRVFNMARHRAFSAWFGAAAVVDGQIPTASCVGHHSLTLAIHILGAKSAGIAIENPRQVPAFAYSQKFGPRPPCFSRAGLVEIENKRLLLVAGTASVRGEESIHNGSLESQLCETMVNLRAVVSEGRCASGLVQKSQNAQSLSGVLATRVYFRRSEDLEWLERNLPAELVNGAEVEFVHADICREELLVEIEIIVDVTRA